MLILSSKHKQDSLVTEISNLLSNYESAIWTKWRERNNIRQDKDNYELMMSEILHSTDAEHHSVLYYINKNGNLKNGLELLYNERYSHKNRAEALQCIRRRSGNFLLDSWLIDTYKIVDPSNGCGRKLNAIVAVAVQILLSILFFASDYVTDLLLIIQYWFMAFDTEHILNSTCNTEVDYETCLAYEIGLNKSMTIDDFIPQVVHLIENVTCSKTRKWTSCTDLDIETTKDQYIPAFWVMLLTIIISTVTYLWITIKTKVADEKPWYVKIFLKPLWPVFYLIQEYELRSNTNQKLEISLQQNEKLWKLLKSVENGVENYFQFLIQLYLLAPYISFLRTLPVQELLEMSLSNVLGIFNPPESLCGGNGGYSALGKLFLSVLSLTYGVASRQTTKRGQTLGQTIQNLALWLSYLMLCVVRILSIFSLLALKNPVLPVIAFATIHFTSVFLILLITQECSYKDIFQKKNNNSWRTHLKRVLMDIFPVILSCLASNTFIINFHDVKRGTPTFKKQFCFQVVVFLENLVLLLLPLIWTELYPSSDCFKSSASVLYIAGGLWISGICLLVRNFLYPFLKFIHTSLHYHLHSFYPKSV